MAELFCSKLLCNFGGSRTENGNRQSQSGDAVTPKGIQCWSRGAANLKNRCHDGSFTLLIAPFHRDFHLMPVQKLPKQKFVCRLHHEHRSTDGAHTREMTRVG